MLVCQRDIIRIHHIPSKSMLGWTHKDLGLRLWYFLVTYSTPCSTNYVAATNQKMQKRNNSLSILLGFYFWIFLGCTIATPSFRLDSPFFIGLIYGIIWGYFAVTCLGYFLRIRGEFLDGICPISF